MKIRTRKKSESGFSLVEILTVIGIIGVLSALTAPPIYSYLRQYRIRGAVQEVTSNLNNARNRAIMKSANYGVMFVIENRNTYWIHMEDDQQATGGPLSGARQAANFVTPDQAQSLRFQLPGHVVFAAGNQCGAVPAPTPAYGPNAYGVRFNRLGAACQPGSGSTCPEMSPVPSDTLLQNDTATGNTTLCLQDRRDVPVSDLTSPCATCPSRWLRVTAGGRILGQP